MKYGLMVKHKEVWIIKQGKISTQAYIIWAWCLSLVRPHVLSVNFSQRPKDTWASLIWTCTCTAQIILFFAFGTKQYFLLRSNFMDILNLFLLNYFNDKTKYILQSLKMNEDVVIQSLWLLHYFCFFFHKATWTQMFLNY